jgi:hypothetical protein
MKTLQRGQTLLSTWDGNASRAYPLEMEIDIRGRLAWYWGRPGWHQSLYSVRPVADGRWHHVALVHSADRSSYRMFVDGFLVDSLYTVNLTDTGPFLPLTLGGRPDSERRTRYKGWIDELRIWDKAKTLTEIRTNMRIPQRAAEGLRFVDGFDARLDQQRNARPFGVQEIRRSDLMLLNPVADLAAVIEDGLVGLKWSISSPQSQRIVIERSSDAIEFLPVGSLYVDEPADGRTHQFGFDDPLPVDIESVWYYRIRQIYPDDAEQVSSVVKVGMADAKPMDAILLGNSPNPFNNTTLATFEVREQQEVHLSVWSVGGNLVDVLADRVFDEGSHQVRFTADDLPSGIYFLLLRTVHGVQTAKMTLMK